MIMKHEGIQWERFKIEENNLLKTTNKLNDIYPLIMDWREREKNTRLIFFHTNHAYNKNR